MAFSVLTEALSKAQHSLSEFLNFLRSLHIDTDWLFYTVVALITVIVTLIGTWLISVVMPRRHQRKQRQQEIDTHIKRMCITFPPPPPKWRPEQLQREKSQFFQSRSLKRENVFSYREFFVERELLNCPELCIAKSSTHAKPWRRSHSHVNIYGDRGQGKTVILAALFLGHSKTKGVRLWMKSPESPTHEDEDYFSQYLTTPKIKRQKFVALFIDDYSRGNDSSEARIRKRNIIEAARAQTPFGQTRIIYTVSDQRDNEADENLHLFLTETEEQSFLRMIACEAPVLVDPSYTDITYALGLLGGERQYSSDLTSFLSLIVDKLFQADSVSLPKLLRPAHFRDDPATWQAIQLIAAFSLGGINAVLPAKHLERLVPTANLSELENITERQIVRIHNIGFTTAPYYASKILASRNATDLENMYLQVFQACISRNTATDFDLVRLILSRLAKGRHFTFLQEEKAGAEIAQGLYLGISGRVIDHCCSSESASTLCSWAATTAKLKRIDHARALCKRLVSLPTADPLRGSDFVNLAVTQRALLSSLNTADRNAQSDTRDVVDNCLKLLASSFVYALENPSQEQDELPRVKESESRRLNEILEAYLAVLLRAGKLYDAEQIIDELKLENGDGFDSLTLSVGARVLAKTDAPAAERMFRKALKKAEKEYSIRKSPDRLATVKGYFVRFLKDQGDNSYDEEMMARFTEMLELIQKWALGWEGQKRADYCKEYVRYLTQCKYEVLKNHSPHLQSLVLPILLSLPEHGGKVISHIEGLLMGAETRNRRYEVIKNLLGEEHQKWRRRTADL